MSMTAARSSCQPGATLNGGPIASLSAPNLAAMSTTAAFRRRADRGSGEGRARRNKTAHKPAPQHFGRNVDDGGPVEFSNGYQLASSRNAV